MAGLDKALSALYRRNVHVIKLGLEPMRALDDALGNPSRAFLSIHIAGTNGKGSVAAMVESVLRAAGLRTGLYTSPHLDRFNERIRVNGVDVEDKALQDVMERVEAADAVIQEAGERSSTFFEFSTAMAFEVFAREKVQVAVVETGLGGRLDATNILMPQVTALTTIGLDHAMHLGDTLEKVAAEKAGIIKPGVPVVLGRVGGDARRVLEARARELDAPVLTASERVSASVLSEDWHGQKIRLSTAGRTLPPVKLALPGRHQVENAIVALAVIEALEDVLKIAFPDETLVRGFNEARWPGRLQVLSERPLVITDAAHNPEGAEALSEALGRLAAGGPVHILAGFSVEKDAAGILKPLKGKGRSFSAVVLDHERAMPLDKTLHAFSSAGIEPTSSGLLRDLLPGALDEVRQNGGCLCIAGSVYLAGEAIRAFS